ncbi:MAG: thiamine pyrophosphate-dependent enzyme, partial [Pseudomonadota bacterium]
SQTALSTSNHGELMSLACKKALDQQDVAHLIFPDDMQTLPSASPAGSPEGRRGRVGVRPCDADLADALSRISDAKRPIIIVGHGAYGARENIAALAEKLGAPVLTTFKAKGLIPDDHPNAGGVLGRSGTPIASWFMNETDLILALGSSFSNHTGIEKSKPIIQVDYDRGQLGKFHAVELPVWSDIGAFCEEVVGKARRAVDADDQITELKERWEIWRNEKRNRLAEDSGEGLHSAAIFAALSRLAPDDTIFAVDVGNNTYSFGRYLETKGRQRVLMSGYLGSIGFGFPAAMGAWAATKDFDSFRNYKVISISGDGGFGQYPMDFTTAVKYGMNITHILLNNGELGKISKEQRAGEWDVWETNLHNPSFAAFARLCGGLGKRVTDSKDLEKVILEALEEAGPSLVEIMTDAELV